MKTKRKLGLGAKFIFVTSTAILLLMFLLLLVQMWSFRNNSKQNSATVQSFLSKEIEGKKSMLDENLNVKGRALLAYLVQLGAEKMKLSDYDSLNRYVYEIQKNKEVVAAVYYNNDGRAITSERSTNEPGLIELTEKILALGSGERLGSAKIWMTSRYSKEIIKIAEEKLYDNLEILEKRFSEQSKELIIMIGLVSLGAFLIIALVLFFGVKLFITKPINRIVEELNEGAEQVANASSHVSSGSQTLAEGSSEQAASLEESSSSLEEISAMTRQNANNTKEAARLVDISRQSMKKSHKSLKSTSECMSRISTDGEKTAKIIKSIDEIAFQTNLLALNAAVESARAGEAGAGFAVVADEVRNLAMRAAAAAKDTEELISSTLKNIQEGSKLVGSTMEEFYQMGDDAKKVSELFSEISVASEEQTRGIEQINTTVAEMDRVVQQNAANAEESASASEELKLQAEQMKFNTEDLIALVGGAVKERTADRGTIPPLTQAETLKGHFPAFQKKEQGVAVYKPKEVSPDQVIPLDDDDFKDF